MTEISRDKGALCAILSVFFILGCWMVANIGGEQTDSQIMLVFGIYYGSVLGCANRVALIGYFNEKKKKMMSFLIRVGESAIDQFFHS
jgi:hypothetical protein